LDSLKPTLVLSAAVLLLLQLCPELLLPVLEYTLSIGLPKTHLSVECCNDMLLLLQLCPELLLQVLLGLLLQGALLSQLGNSPGLQEKKLYQCLEWYSA
jgi:hypothetical protein